MTRADALKKWVEVYTIVMTEVNPYCLKTAVEYGVMDMINMTKHLDEESAALMINDDAEWMLEKMAWGR